LLREHQDMSDQQSAHVSVTQRNDEQRIKSSESSQVSREKPVRLEDTERLMQHNMDLIWQQAGTSGISHDKYTTSLPTDSTEAGLSMVNADMAQRAMITGSNEQDLRSETTAGSSVASGSNARQSVKESMSESAARLEIIYVSCWAVC
jgi:tRNA(adenine34) deaminase